MTRFGSTVEHWCKKWMPASVKMFFTPLVTMTASIVLGYLVIGPIATLITNLLSLLFSALFGLPVIGSVLAAPSSSTFWMCLVIFGFHWSLVPIALVNLTTLGYDYILGAVIAHSFFLVRPLRRVPSKNKDTNFRGIYLPAIISSFFFGVTEPAHLRRRPSRQEGLRGREHRLRRGRCSSSASRAPSCVSGWSGRLQLAVLPPDRPCEHHGHHPVWSGRSSPPSSAPSGGLRPRVRDL